MSFLKEGAAAAGEEKPGKSGGGARLVAVHALAMLMLDGQIPADKELIDGVIASKTARARRGNRPAS